VYLRYGWTNTAYVVNSAVVLIFLLYFLAAILAGEHARAGGVQRHWRVKAISASPPPALLRRLLSVVRFLPILASGR